MSEREQCIDLIQNMDETQLPNVLAILTSFINAIEEAKDDAFCLQILEDYENDPDPDKGETISIQDFAKELRIDLE